MPLYSLPKLLSPLITHAGQLRDAVVLLTVELTPVSSSPRGNWKEICRQSLETLRRCVYPDKDLVLPVMGIVGTSETFFVAASTDVERATIMINRIRGQLEAGAGFKAAGALKISATAVPLPSREDARTLEDRVQAVAGRITEMAMTALASKPSRGAANGDVSAATNKAEGN